MTKIYYFIEKYEDFDHLRVFTSRIEALKEHDSAANRGFLVTSVFISSGNTFIGKDSSISGSIYDEKVEV